MAQKNRWHPVMLPDDYLRKMKQDLSEVEAHVGISVTQSEIPETWGRAARLIKERVIRH